MLTLALNGGLNGALNQNQETGLVAGDLTSCLNSTTLDSATDGLLGYAEHARRPLHRQPQSFGNGLSARFGAGFLSHAIR